jgi:hypothetical protein
MEARRDTSQYYTDSADKGRIVEVGTNVGNINLATSAGGIEAASTAAGGSAEAAGVHSTCESSSAISASGADESRLSFTVLRFTLVCFELNEDC